MTSRLMAEGISWGPGGTHNIVHPASFSVEAGKNLMIVGPNGAGKSTLLRMLYRYLRPRSGRVKLNGQCIWSMDARVCARHIAAVLQEQAVDLALTVREIIALGRIPHQSGISLSSRHDMDIVDRVLEQLELPNLADRRLHTLSGGERQRVMFARALAQEPDVVVMDEPTNHLDIRHQLELMTLVCRMGIAIVCTLHDLNLAVKFADEILILSGGRTLAYGPPSDVVDEGLLSEAFSVNARLDRLESSNSNHFTFQLPDRIHS